MSGLERSAPRIVVTMGDPAGIGPEVVLRALSGGAVNVSIVGSLSAMMGWADLLSCDLPCDVVDVGDAQATPGCPTAAGASAALGAIETAAGMCREGRADAMVTAPVSKSAVAALGVDFIGHTEFLAGLTGAPDFVMTFVHGAGRIGLATTHLPVSDVPRAITRELVVSKLRTLDGGLRDWLGVAEPRIAVAALNPHGGEGGAFGEEEATAIVPAVEEARASGVHASGPFPADALFARASFGHGDDSTPRGAAASSFDAVLAMYHDQGTIPAKLLAGGAGVNLTVGLPIVRTSVDHGTAFELAGKGVADSRSMAAALALADQIARRREGGRGR
ncbi:MAG: 4-hydroxythreonine-4-phosphate dehydrogenase PdxA [Candidatus Eisenbacteria bacterium]